jgi:hypothetical protein
MPLPLQHSRLAQDYQTFHRCAAPGRTHRQISKKLACCAWLGALEISPVRCVDHGLVARNLEVRKVTVRARAPLPLAFWQAAARAARAGAPDARTRPRSRGMGGAAIRSAVSAWSRANRGCGALYDEFAVSTSLTTHPNSTSICTRHIAAEIGVVGT